MDSAADLDAFFAFQDNQFGSDQTLDDGTFAGLSEALAASNAASCQYNENWMMDSSLLDYRTTLLHLRRPFLRQALQSPDPNSAAASPEKSSVRSKIGFLFIKSTLTLLRVRCWPSRIVRD